MLVTAGGAPFDEIAGLVERHRQAGLDLLVRGERVERVARLLEGPVLDGAPTVLVRGGGEETAAIGAGQRLLDLILGAVLLSTLLPVLAAIALAVKLTSRGPVLHRALVIGQSGQSFVWRKFRTMRVGAPADRHREAARRFITGTDGDFRRTGVFKMQEDDRVTRVGALLRRHSLDELPQLFDVIAGRMSLVGPRPCLPYEWDLYAPHHRRRFDVKPGMTGLWQVLGRSRVDFEEMVFLDRCWAWNRSIGLYLGTLARTARVVLRGEGGY